MVFMKNTERVFDKMLNWFKQIWGKGLDEGEAIFLGVPSTEYPEKYSEGLFFWTNHEGNSQTSLEYHVERGGDPEVF